MPQSIAKVIYKANASATPEVWMDATPATAAAADILAPKTAMLADGVLTTGTGTGGGGGLEYEEGTWTPASDIYNPTLNFANSHTSSPIFVGISDASDTYYTTENSNYYWAYYNFYDCFGVPCRQSSSGETKYAMVYSYRGTIATTLNGTWDSGNTTNKVTSTGFTPDSAGSSRYWRSGRTYKWIAVWPPTT